MSHAPARAQKNIRASINALVVQSERAARAQGINEAIALIRQIAETSDENERRLLHTTRKALTGLLHPKKEPRRYADTGIGFDGTSSRTSDYGGPFA